MIQRIRFTLAMCTAIALLPVPCAMAGELTVQSVEPAAHSLTAPVGAAVTVHFDQPVSPDSINKSSFWAFGRWSGTVRGEYVFADDDQTVSLVPDHPFSHGEHVMVILSHDIEAAGGGTLRAGGYSFQFWTMARPAALDLVEIDTMSTRTSPEQSTRSYGGLASDLNGDRFLDITIVNEDSADLRVFLNRADDTGLYDDFMQPTTPVGDRASPSEPTDFNRDGFVDICVANINDNSISVLLGNGDGTFQPQQEVAVGAAPRGIAALDVDGDGDIDIVNTNSSSSNMSVLLNDGTGIFGGPIFFEGGISGEWAIAAADMDDDGLLDLVIGGRSSQRIAVNLGNGDGTFSFASQQNSGGAVWMLNIGDVDGDGNEDVVVANSSNNNGAILIGDGAGGLAPPQTYQTDPFPLATDIADLDGDGDLDWITSSFQGDFFVFTNDGDGTFTFFQELPAPIAASCALALDIDNDGDLDLGLIDELADVVIIVQNSGITFAADLMDLQTVFGSIILGGLDELVGSDDAYLQTRSVRGFAAFEPNLMEIVVGAVAGTNDPASMDLVIESRINHPVGTAKIRLKNWASGIFEQVDIYELGPAEERVTISDIDSTDRVREGDGRIEVAIRHVVIAVFSAAGFDSFIDELAVFLN